MTSFKEILASRKFFEKTHRWVTDDEAGILYTLATLEKPKVVYESGAANGYTASIFACLDISVHTYDPVDRPKVWNKFPDIEENITFHQAPFISVERVNNEKSLFFIDGDHSRRGFQEDMKRVYEIIMPGDIVILHDSGTHPWISRHHLHSELEKFFFTTKRGVSFFRYK